MLCRTGSSVPSDQIRTVLNSDKTLRALSETLYNKRSILVMGRGSNYATCLEGALKLKELTYLHAEGILTGELKHGPLAMVDSESAIIMLIPHDGLFQKSMNALHEVRARRGNPIVICSENDPEIPKDNMATIELPSTVDCLQGILAVIPLQLLAFHIAVRRGLDDGVHVTPPALGWRHCKKWRLTTVNGVRVVCQFISKSSDWALAGLGTSECLR
ncbi:glucosamine--fructose-6-phosphate aminotransferase (isomerizing) [Clonorchis sinensis]|uniref:Glucosamine--fructose-6-phosphate aminotransferase (Isomerizing) n=1 Tax=Clonorchis sinensis TaxID=79923 RepID=G7YU37_CLOSI|nr:glucosamine--fructose-6-phosphate aminotransferase (isomerizing) [Clonorchis sinensis]